MFQINGASKVTGLPYNVIQIDLSSFFDFKGFVKKPKWDKNVKGKKMEYVIGYVRFNSSIH